MAIFRDSRGRQRIDLADIEEKYRCMAGQNRGILLKRYIYAKHLGRPLECGEVVRVIDAAKTETDVNNLKLTYSNLNQNERIKTHLCDDCRNATALLCSWIGRNDKKGITFFRRGDNELVRGCARYKQGLLPPIGSKSVG